MISFDRRRGIESGPSAEESWERASLSVIIGAEMHKQPTPPLKEVKNEEDSVKQVNSKNILPLILDDVTRPEEPTIDINDKSDVEKENKVVKVMEEIMSQQGGNDIDKGKSNISNKDSNIGISKDNNTTTNTTNTTKSDINTINNNPIPSDFTLSNEEVLFISTLNLLTTKPVVYLANKVTKIIKIKKYLKSILHVKPIIFSLEEEGTKVLIDKMVRMGCSVLDLITYFTVGSVIHKDFEKYFVSAEVFNHKDLHELGSEADVRKKGKCYTKRNMYVVQMGLLYTLSLIPLKWVGVVRTREKVCVRVGV
ncbi:DUF933 domain-containing protein [Hamiltosporidium tvaerminnensis]|uniref:DUF933 domain-containing protein n=1 Tax=Hamiltosporidium tvaerminnensis TaxID=1176355 RepID=A0A4Q9LQG4_9MICR|nr:DUF933 domain-containing protein [Hamiltosporidium tvaerminnensis]